MIRTDGYAQQICLDYKASATAVLFCVGGMLLRTHNRAVDEVDVPQHVPVMLGILLQSFPYLPPQAPM
jgi:hypothetical protein